MILARHLCTGCGMCGQVCPFEAITFKNCYPVIGENCRECGECARQCPSGALSEAHEPTAPSVRGRAEYWVMELAGVSQANLTKVTLELLSAAHRLSREKPAKVVLVTGVDSVPRAWLSEAASVGCDEVLCLQGNRSGDIMHFWADAEEQAARARKPEVILFPAVADGRDLAPKVACRLQTGLTADCTDLQMDGEGNLLQIRPTYGGSIIATIRTPLHRPQMASVRPNVLPIMASESANMPTVSAFKVETGDDKGVRLIEAKTKNAAFQPLEEAEIIIAGGYGLGSRENFELLFKLSAKLNAAVAASRKAVDMGWAPAEIQVGQTGKTVAPKLYMAFGISGALQHTLGMNRSARIIAINTDPAAPIMKMSDVPVLGDSAEILRKMLDTLENGRSIQELV